MHRYQCPSCHGKIPTKHIKFARIASQPTGGRALQRTKMSDVECPHCERVSKFDRLIKLK